MLVCLDVCRALKEHVLKEMGEARAPRPFVCRTDVIPEIHRDDWGGVVLGQGNK